MPKDKYPDYPANQLYTAFEGLALTESFACPVCYYTAGERWLKQHMAAEHSHIPLPAQFTSCLGQILNKGAANTILRVVQPQALPPTPSSAAEPLDAFTAFHQSQALAAQVTAPNNRFISPFLTRTNWHVHIQDYDAEELCSLVSMPKDEYIEVTTAIHSYFAVANNYLDTAKTPELVLQKLNSEDPDVQ